MLLPGVQSLDLPDHSIVTVLTMLPQLYLNLKLYFGITYECKSVPVGLLKWVSLYWPLIFDWKFYALFFHLLGDLYSSPNIVRVIVSTKKWDRLECNIFGGGETCIQDFWRETLRGRDQLQDLGIDGRIILRSIFRKWNVGHGLDKSGSG